VIVGQVVKENDSLLIAKWKWKIVFFHQGWESISVLLGDAVDKGQLLIESE
jgi:hypothetical protein